MDARIADVMAEQWGLITRAQAIAAGVGAHTIDHRLRSGAWSAIRRGVYAETAYVRLLQRHDQRRLVIDRAASLRIAEPHVFSHHSAAHLLRLPVLREPQPTTHVGRPGIVGSHVRHGVTHHLAPYRPDQVRTESGVDVLDAARTAVDIARTHGFLQGLVAVDSARRMGVSLDQLESAVAAMTDWPGVTVARAAVAASCAEADSVLESVGRDFVTALGFGVPQAQFGLTAEGRTVWCDLRLGRHIFEVDGRVKYRALDDGGFAVAPEAALWDEKTRQDFVTGFKTGVSRLTADDLLGPLRSRERARARCLREYRDTCARFGTDIADLAAFRPRGPRPRPRLPSGPLLPRWRS